jgi:hypothetical protein
VGENIGGRVSNCETSGSVQGNEIVGRLVGWNIGEVSNSVASGASGGNFKNAGRLIGLN